MIFSVMSHNPPNEPEVKFVEADSYEEALTKLFTRAPNWRDRDSINMHSHGALIR